ncbi:HEAT repeat domain-containing protein [Marinihelvus fidelis]|uniref:HEAT repeat domain-containing protein n=1 Tax=Marinihelvus fidelis TaxID=2613842 RepID=A0A5N0TJV2_9GAMM|nr:HEAT repeat domain-containing protein [Marinihelvus fidelis]KAA9134206.1 HEAT repeat domain-containing protein [Marinihelvus fidelis]
MIRAFVFTLGLSATLVSADARPPFAADGWYRWQIDAVETRGEWCCHTWNNNRPTRMACDLDQDGFSVDHVDEAEPQAVTTGAGGAGGSVMNLFARVEGGEITKLRPFSPGCEVHARDGWTNLGPVATGDSLAWLGDSDTDDRMMAVALHAGTEARNELVETALHGNDPRTREHAIFWMGQLRVEETRDVLLELMTAGDREKIREQAIFSYAQSPAPDRIDVLIALIENTRQDMHDRKHALFWLAQADSPEGVDYIQALLTGSP